MPGVLLLDAEGVSVLATPTERGVSAKRAHAILDRARDAGALVRVPATTLTEAGRTATRRANLQRVLNARGIDVLAVDAITAFAAAVLMERHHRPRNDIFDAFLAAAAIQCGPGCVVATSDPDDLRVLLQDHAVEVFAL